MPRFIELSRPTRRMERKAVVLPAQHPFSLLLWQHHNFPWGNTCLSYQFMCFGWGCLTHVPGVGILARTSWLGQVTSLDTVTGLEMSTRSKWVQWELIPGFLLEWHKKTLWSHETVSNKDGANLEVAGPTPTGHVDNASPEQGKPRDEERTTWRHHVSTWIQLYLK